MSGRPVVVKFGGELLEEPDRLSDRRRRDGARRAAGTPLVVVHGGGKEIDAALKGAGIEKRQVDGLRITDEPTLEVVVAVLAGAVNTRLVAALGRGRACAAVGLTGADGGCGLSEAAPPHRSGGRPHGRSRARRRPERGGGRAAADDARSASGFVPVIACIGVERRRPAVQRERRYVRGAPGGAAAARGAS